MQSASKGSLSVPPQEMIEILVHLALHNKVFGQQAQLTLAGWDEAASRAAASNPATSKEVLNYMISPANLRPVLLPALLANPSVSGDAILELASHASREVVEVMLKSERVTQSSVILHALSANSSRYRDTRRDHSEPHHSPPLRSRAWPRTEPVTSARGHMPLRKQKRQ